MTENERRQRAVEAARGWLGRRMQDGSHCEIIDVYNAHTPLPQGYRMPYTAPWCAAFVSAVGMKAGLSDIILPECSCPRMVELYRAAGRWMEDDGYIPSPGDIIMYDWQDDGAGDNTGTPDHVGMVEWVENRMMTVIEGNISASVARRSLPVNGQNIRGYCLPDYAGAEAPPETPQDAPQAQEGNYTVKSGDSLWSIAGELYGDNTMWAVLAELNGIEEPFQIFAGQALTGIGYPEQDGRVENSYVIQPGDTLSGIAKRLGISVEKLAADNKIKDPNFIRAGERLVI